MRYKKILLKLSLVIGVFALIYLIWAYPAWVSRFEQYQDDSLQEKAARVLEEQTPLEPTQTLPSSPAPSTTLASATPTVSDHPATSNGNEETTATETLEAVNTDAEPSPTPPRSVSTEISALREEFNNNDIVGYLTIDGTAIAYPVVQAADNDYYLRRDLYGKTNKAGTLFMDYENDTASFDENTIIYGHNMKNGTMFHDLRHYQDESFFKNHPYIRLITLEGETRWEIFAFYQTSTEFYYIQTHFENKLFYQKFLKQIKEKSLYETGVSVDYNDKTLTLSTCANEGGDQRYALHAKLLP